MRWEDDDDGTRLGEDFGQVDGDEGPSPGTVNFTPAGAGQPWLREGIPPWHLWGNTQRIVATVQDSGAAQRVSSPGQLVKIAYKRPETWHWAFAAKLISGPDATLTEFVQVEVAFDLTIGVGRSVIILQSAGVVQDKAFEQYFFSWGNGASILFPRDAQLYTTQVLGPNRTFRTNAPFPNQDGFPVPGAFVSGPTVIDQIVAQDLQLNCRVIALAPTGAAAIGQLITVEVSAQFAPKTHIRPDWYYPPDAPLEAIFPGSEVGGK